MGGGPKVTPIASGTATASFSLSDSMSAKECSSFAVRSSHGFSETKRKRGVRGVRAGERASSR